MPPILDADQTDAARFALSTLFAPDSTRNPGEDATFQQIASNRILNQSGTDAATATYVATCGLHILGKQLEEPPNSTHIDLAKLVLRIDSDPTDERRSIIDTYRPTAQWTIKSAKLRTLSNTLSIDLLRPTQPQTLANTLHSTPNHPTSEAEIKTEDEPAPDLNLFVPPIPIEPSSINYARLGGTDSMITTATAGPFKSARAIFERLYAAEKSAVDFYNKWMDSTEATPSLSNQSHVLWLPQQVELSTLIPASSIVNVPTKGFDLTSLLSSKVMIWSSSQPVRGIPPINPRYKFEASALATIVIADRHNKNCLLSGPTGCGKTTLIEQIAARFRRPFFRIPVDGEMRRRDILGGWLQEATETGSRTVWQDGMLTIAYAMPSIVVFDELDHADADLVYAAHEALENVNLRLVEQPKRLIPMHPACRLTATANTRGAGDMYGQYAIKTPMSEASRNRFSYFISCNYLLPKDETDLLRQTYPTLPQTIAPDITKMAAQLRKSLLDGDIRTACSTRQTLDIANDIVSRVDFDTNPPKLKVRQAFDRIIASRAADASEEAAINGLLDATLGSID